MADKELRSIQDILNILESLENKDAKSRVLRYVLQRADFGIENQPQNLQKGHAKGSVGPSKQEFIDFADLFHQASPKTGAEKALLAGYWLQTCKGFSDFSGYEANKELKKLGQGAPNITTSFNSLEKQKLAFTAQKTGKGKQAKKRYRLSPAGLEEASKLISETESDY